MLSMTGFGTARVELSAGEAPASAPPAAVSIEARAVNHRYLDVRVRAPSRLLDHTSVVEETARKHMTRGRIEISLRIEGSPNGTLKLDRDRAGAAYAALTALRDDLAPGEAVPLSLLSAVPDLFVVEGDSDRVALRKALTDATARACDELRGMRKREGQALAEDLATRLATVRALVAQIEPRTETIVDEYRERLRARLARLLQGTEVELDRARLEHEVAMMADRGDVSEEITRLSSHVAQFEELTRAGDEPVGRKLDFLLQEMGREVNTIGSKVGDVEITRKVLDLKTELERLREQVQNVL